jgi:hypothetical protein
MFRLSVTGGQLSVESFDLCFEGTNPLGFLFERRLEFVDAFSQ